MHASVEQQQGSRSPKPVNGSAASPLKHSPDSVQNSSSNLSSHRKGKKREQSDQSFDVSKRERLSKPDDGDFGQLKSESTLNFEIAKFSENGGLTDSEAVSRLVRLMQPEKSEKKIDLAARCMLAGVIAATDNYDCLNQFVQLRGLLVLNEWLQEVHKGKISDSGNIKSGDKSVDDFLLALLRALDKLPVNLNALKMCNIGKSVNHLRSHKNSEIQKKARTLVDTWKKRVEVEMSIGEADRSHHESSHGGSGHHSSDAAIRSPIAHQSSLKSTSVRHVPGEYNSKSTSAHPGGSRSTMSPTSTTDNSKDGQSRLNANGGSFEPQMVVKEEKSSSSSQSHTNSQCSSEHAKQMVPGGKENTRRSTAGSKSLNKTVGTTKHRKATNGPSSGVQRETASNKSSSMAKNSVVEKSSQNALDASVQESNNHKIIVKIAGRGRGPAPSVAGGSLEDSSCRNSRDSSPAHSEKHDQSDVFVRGNKQESQQYFEVDGSSASAHQKFVETKRLSNVSKIACSSSRTDVKSRKASDSSFSPMNALIESCAKASEANVSMSAGDDVGMNLLASVAAREISTSDVASPALSPHRSSKVTDNSSSNIASDQKQLLGDNVIQHGRPSEVADTGNHIAVVPKVDGESSNLCDTKAENLHQNVEGCMKNNGVSVEKMGAVSTPVSVTCTTRSISDPGSETVKGEVIATEESRNELPAASPKVGIEAQNVTSVSVKDEVEAQAQAQRDNAACLHNDDTEQKNVNHLSRGDAVLEQSSLVALQCDPVMNTNEKPVMVSGGTSQHLVADMSNDVKSEKTDAVSVSVHDSTNVASKLEKETSAEKRVEVEGCQTSENKESGAPGFQTSCDVALQKEDSHSTVEAGKLPAVEEENKDKNRPTTENVAVESSSGPDVDSKLGFDLNEGFDVDEGKNSEPVNLAAGVVGAGQTPLSVSCGLPASITVAAAAKGPFVPPDDLLWNKRELGWKGSAATSAFRPAEPRKSMEVPLGPSKASLPDASSFRRARFPLDIDLNVADESSSQEFSVRNNSVCELSTTGSLRSSGGLDLDLNKVDEAPEMAHVGRHMASNIQRVEGSTQHSNVSTSNVFSNCAAAGRCDFDLNDGPAMDDMPVEQMPPSQPYRGHIPFQQPLGPRVNGSDVGNCFPWYPPGTSYSVSLTPSVLPDREAFSIVGIGGGPQRVMGGPTSALSFNPDAYRGSVLSSSPALSFPSAPFQYPVLPFGTSYPLPTSALAGGSSGYMDPTTGGRMSAIPSQMVGNAAAAVSFQYPHAYVVSRSLPDVGNTGVVESSHKWGKQGLDLNSGPGAPDVEGRDESFPTVSRQLSTISSQSLADEQAMMYSMGGGHLKRKEPEGGWNIDKFNFKQSSWR